MNREPHKWRTLALCDVHRSRMWQTVICLSVVVGMAVVYGLLILTAF